MLLPFLSVGASCQGGYLHECGDFFPLVGGGVHPGWVVGAGVEEDEGTLLGTLGGGWGGGIGKKRFDGEQSAWDMCVILLVGMMKCESYISFILSINFIVVYAFNLAMIVGWG